MLVDGGWASKNEIGHSLVVISSLPLSGAGGRGWMSEPHRKLGTMQGVWPQKLRLWVHLGFGNGGVPWIEPRLERKWDHPICSGMPTSKDISGPV